MFRAARRDKSFKDYCLILQVHPEADGAMVDAAYWHLARRYNEAAPYDRKTRAKLEELNEAYSVLGSAERREQYMKVRAETLGEGALPLAPGPERQPAPLSVMNRQRPHERESPDIEHSQHQDSATKRLAVGAFLLLGLAAAALTATMSPLVAAAAVGATLVALLGAAGILAALPRLRTRKLPSVRHPKIVRLAKVRATRERKHGRAKNITLDAQSEQLRRIAAKHEPAPVDEKSDTPPSSN